MMLQKEVKTLGVPWEGQYGYVQAVRVDDTIYVSGQLSHDDRGNMIGAAPLDDLGNIRDHSNMEIQMRQSYANAKKVLGEFGVTLENVVEEVLYVTNMEKAFALARSERKLMDHKRRKLIEIKLIAKPAVVALHSAKTAE